VVNSESWAVVIPAHNSSLNIRQTITELSGYFQLRNLTGQVVIVENGSSDDTWDVVSSIVATEFPFELIKLQSERGLGNAIRKGLNSVSTELVLITADDLPFGFSDLDGYLELSETVDIAIGSKAHPLTAGTRSLIREVMSSVFRLLRRLIVGVNLGDTQGSILGKSDVICPLSSITNQPGYLMTTELLARATQMKSSIIELPVIYRNDLRKSNINVIEDSIKMLRGLFEVRRSLQTRID
jgi:glycosyltransferase involved in cell wall biosynthesis